MAGKKIEEIEQAIGTLTQEELEELRVWLDEYAGPRPIDRRIKRISVRVDLTPPLTAF